MSGLRHSDLRALRLLPSLLRRLVGDRRFTHIIEGRKPGAVIYDTPAVVAFLDAQPSAPGHVLVVPRRRTPSLLQTPPDTCQEIFEAARRIAKAQTEALGAEGIRLIQSNGRAAGQSVFHFHLHVVPVWASSTVAPAYTPAEIAAALRDALRASFPTAGDETPP